MTNRPELVALRSFLSVYRTGGVARAAEALHLSQPAVSHWVGLSPDLVPAVLRDEIDVALLTKIEGVPTRRMYLVQLLEERFVLVGPAGAGPAAAFRRLLRGDADGPAVLPRVLGRSAARAGPDRQ